MGREEVEGEGPGECAAAANATWWWGCNVCWCGEPGDAPACTRLWCGLPDCQAQPASPQCRADEVCVPAGSALCLRAPCAPLGECRRVAGRRVEPPPLPAPTWCWPTGGAAGARGSAWCARLALELARERLARGAHVERACGALRRALAAALAPGGARAVLVLLCDLSPDDDDLLELALWSPEEEGAESAALVAEGVRALSELVSRRRLAHHPLLAAALRLRAHTTPAPPAHSAPASAPPHPSAGVLAVAALVPLAVCAATVAAVFWLRRRRATAAERSRRCDEEKSNNLQNEENLRRYANPIRDEPKAGAASSGGETLAQTHSLYKAQNADARNNTAPPPGPRLPDKEFTKRALPLPAHADAPHAAHPTISVLAPPERLTVLV
ncbi:Protein serrate [Eumeta japonica]|uniref:Protein serrate n=1 Tax=Eumeta variegata TaxID=151549 RepID=A0A4C1V1W9_EUMVA|nr:Protein serrate [Eumeta japonica]